MTLAFKLEDVFFGTNTQAKTVFTSPNSLLNRLLPNALGIAGLVFFLLILGAGFTMVKNAGGNASPQDAAKARSALTFAVVGFLLVVGAYFILQMVGLMTGIDFTNPNLLP
jgi:hypothetical protein